PLCSLQLSDWLSGPARLRSLRRSAGALPQRLHVLPQLLPLLPFALGQLLQGVAAHAGEILVLLPVLHPFAYRGADLVGLLLQQPAIRGQIGPQPVQGLLAQAAALFHIERVGVLALATPREGSGAGGVIAELSVQVVGQLRLLGESLPVEASGGRVLLLVRH